MLIKRGDLVPTAYLLQHLHSAVGALQAPDVFGGLFVLTPPSCSQEGSNHFKPRAL